MENYKLTIAYDGADFFGWQRLNNKRTVQGEIEKNIKKVTYKSISLNGAGRTDALAHANGQVANFKQNLEIPFNRFREILNRNLPCDISILEFDKVDSNFHSRYDSKGKKYRYRVYVSKDKKVFLNKYFYHFPYKLDYNKMIEAKNIFIGKNDFRSFAAQSVVKENTIRKIYKIDIIKENEFYDFVIYGDGFLYKMVRTIIGNLLMVGRGKISYAELKDIMLKKDIRASKFTAPANGLYLEKVFY